MVSAQQKEWSLPVDVATIALVVKSARVKRPATAQAYSHAEVKDCCLSASTFHALVLQLQTECDDYLQKPKQAKGKLRSGVILLVMYAQQSFCASFQLLFTQLSQAGTQPMRLSVISGFYHAHFQATVGLGVLQRLLCEGPPMTGYACLKVLMPT